eukprot:7890716-Pyramimonas_sp.AAC.1
MASKHMVGALIAPPAMSRISIMRGRMHVNIVRACGTPEPSRGWSCNRAIRLPRGTRVVQVVQPRVGDQHGGRNQGDHGRPASTKSDCILGVYCAAMGSSLLHTDAC